MKKTVTTTAKHKGKKSFRTPLIVCSLLLYFTAFTAWAQTTLTVKGSVINASSQKSLDYVSVVLLQLPDSAVVASEMTNEAGNYTFAQVKPGKYTVKALMVGFSPATSITFEVKQQAVQVPAIAMQEKANALQEVVVKGQKPLLEQEADRVVMNVEQLNTAGDNALEVLKYAPGVRLDKDDNIIFRGSGSVQVLINGKMTYMSGAELQSYLKSLPAAAVSKVELIANPPASFDAAGTAGIINIKLKRDETMGMNGSVNLGAGYGKYEKVWGGLNLNYNTGKVSLYTRLNAGHYNSFNRLTLKRNINDSLYNQVNYWHPITRSYNATAGADYFISKKHTVGIMVKGYASPENALTTSNSTNYEATGKTFGSMSMRNPKVSCTDNYSLNLNYKFDIDSTGRSLTMDADYVNYSTDADELFTNNFYAATGEATQAPLQLRSLSDAEASIRSFKVDYVHPFGKGYKAETGLKTSRVSNTSDIRFEELQEQGWVNDANRTNSFVYNETINAAYLSLSGKFSDKLSLKAGLRAEQTVADGYSVNTGEVVDLDYLKFFPSVFVSYTPSESNQFSVSYSRRISRPSYRSLNPFTFYSDPYTALQGNPLLGASFSNSLQFNYTYKSFQILSLSYVESNDFVSNVIRQNDETKVSISRPENLSKATYLSASSGGSLPLKDWWTATLQLEGSYNTVISPLQGAVYNRSRFSWSVSTEESFNLAKDFKLQLSAFYSSPSVQGLYQTKAGYQIDLGAQKVFLDGKATLSLKLRDVFNTSRFRATLAYNNVNMYWQNQWESRRLNLTFNYKFGSNKVKTARNRKTGTGEEEGRL
ncbi:outer membrane beta-barrel family protein [Pontibacter cellulosilyticus]|uniref:TonB-dependent receptor n=1 Tax=Pontibacter cellulosilyticus TaxID=1720253 RepID=A0A923N277_9BACT|nr:outer membrane beta-barrel family protein [Pontibacter cellulosilyticus]MBC5991530.1 TonB-dependent receptor [Pontibacter cellulosilyticus]